MKTITNDRPRKRKKLYSRTMKLLLTAQQSFPAIEGSSRWDESEIGQSKEADEMT